MGNHLYDRVSINPATEIQLCLERYRRLASGVCHRGRHRGSDLLSRFGGAQPIWNGEAVFRNDSFLWGRLCRIDSLWQFVARTARVHSQHDRRDMLCSDYRGEGAFPFKRRCRSSESRLCRLIARRFLLRRTTDHQCTASRALTRHGFTSRWQKESFSIASVGLPGRARCYPCSHRCCARVTRITTTRLLTLEGAATSSARSQTAQKFALLCRQPNTRIRRRLVFRVSLITLSSATLYAGAARTRVRRSLFPTGAPKTMQLRKHSRAGAIVAKYLADRGRKDRSLYPS